MWGSINGKYYVRYLHKQVDSSYPSLSFLPQHFYGFGFWIFEFANLVEARVPEYSYYRVVTQVWMIEWIITACAWINYNSQKHLIFCEVKRVYNINDD